MGASAGGAQQASGLTLKGLDQRGESRPVLRGELRGGGERGREISSIAATPEEPATITILLRAGIAASALGARRMTPAPHLPSDGRRASVLGRTGGLLPERDAADCATGQGYML